MNKNNLFFKYKIPILALFATFIIYIICYWKSASGLYFDIPAMFSAVFYNHCENPNTFQVFIDERIRFFSNFLVAIPYNVIFIFIKNESPLTALKAFSTSYFIIHFLLLILNFIVAKRTKRFDIATFAFFFYFIFSVPNSIWAVREIHIAMLAYFVILNYFLSKEKLHIIDAIVIIIIQTYLFESFETSAIFGLILFISTIIFIRNKELSINKFYKILIGITSLGIFLYIPIKLYMLNITNKLSIHSGSLEWLSHSELAIKNLFTSNLIIPFFAIGALIILFICKKPLTNKIYLYGIFYLLITISVTFIQTNFISRPLIELVNYSPIFWFLFPILILILILEYLQFNINSKIQLFYEYMLIVTCVFGILNLIWQIKSTFDFNDYKKYLTNEIQKTESTFVSIPNEEFKNNNILRYSTCFGLAQQSIFLTKENEKAKVILPTKECPIYIEKYCAEGPEETYYDEKEDRLILQSSFFKTKTKYWDLTPIAEEFKKQGRVK